MKIYLVGGAVRDRILGKTVQDRDWVVVGSSADEMSRMGYVRVGKDFPVFLHPETKEEYALARTERKSGHGYYGFEIDSDPNVTLEEDLARRDLTINAIAMDEENRFIDPYGGVKDIENRVLKHVTTAFAEDPLRVLRVARFKSRLHHLGFNIDASTIKLMAEISKSGELKTLAEERVWCELHKALMEITPSQFFLTLKECGALAVLFPELENLFGVAQTKEHHPEVDTGIHTMMVLDQSAKLQAKPEVRFAALVHDLGKADTPPDKLPRHIGHEEKSVKRVNQLCSRLKVPKVYHELSVLVARYHTHCHRAFELKAGTVLNLFESIDAFRRPERLSQFLLACKADALGRGNASNNKYKQLEYLLAAFDVAKSVDVKPIIENGVTGSDIRLQLKRKRSQAIAILKNKYSQTAEL